MSANTEAYIALSHSSPRSDVATALDNIINAIPSSITSSARKNLIQALLADLNALGKGRLSHKDAPKALLAVKSLGKDPSGSQLLSSPENLSALLSLSSSCKDDVEASCEALRCIANALLLVETARKTFLNPLVNGGEFCVTALERTAIPEHIFVLSRILFLSTVSAPSYIVTLIDQKFNGRTVVDIIAIKLDLLLVQLLSSAKLAKEAMTDLLKFTFNILLHYPKTTQEEPQNQSALEDGNKVIGDFWSPKLDGLLPPLLRLFASLPQTFPNPIAPPMTHVIHALITIPVSPSLKNMWFPNASRRSASHSPKISHSPQQESHHSEAQSSASPKPSTLDRALSVIAAGRRSLSRSSSPLVAHNIDVLQRAWDLLEVSFNHYFSDNIDPDNPRVRKLVRKESSGNSLDDILSPLVVLISRICQADEIAGARLKNWLVPDDLDRSSPLEGRPDMLGKCLRLLPSVYHVRLKDSVGEMLFAMANSDPSTLSALVGYGNVAGFLFNKGMLSAPPPGSEGASFTTPEGDEINPITGTTVQPKPELPEMTDEEKEREVEKLLWLFDRLERTGAIPREQNPIRKAIQEGKATLGP